MRLSLCVIARDEAATLPRCLAAVEDAVDELCVLDTGSVDGTLELARSLGARVGSLPWQDDFAAARNASLALATGDWILVLDADEELLGEPAAARTALEGFAREHPGCVGRVALESGTGGGATSLARLSRLLPNDGLHRFAGRVHEQVVRLEGAHQREPRRADVELRVRHHGYEADAIAGRRKLERNARLLGLALQERPRDGYLWFQLGRTRALAGDPAGALEALEHALEQHPDDAPWGINALEDSAYALRALGRSQAALARLSAVEERWSRRADTCFLIALLAMDTGDLQRAERGFRRCLELDPRAAGAAESSLAAATVAPAYNLGVMAEVLGQHDAALLHYRRALGYQPDHAPSLEGLQRLGLPA